MYNYDAGVRQISVYLWRQNCENITGVYLTRLVYTLYTQRGVHSRRREVLKEISFLPVKKKIKLLLFLVLLHTVTTFNLIDHC